MNRDELHELMLLYVIDGLEPGERDRIERLLEAGDAAAKQAYAEAAEVVAQLPETLEPVTPDPAVLAGLLEQVKGAGMSEQTSKPSPTAAQPPASLGSVGMWPKLAIAAAFVLGIGLTAFVMFEVNKQANQTNQTSTGTGDGSQQPEDWADIEKVIAEQKQSLAQQEKQLGELKTRMALLNDTPEIKALQETIDEQRQAIEGQRKRIAELHESMALLVGPGVQQAELAGDVEQAKGAQARLMWDPVSKQMRLLTRGLKPLKPGQTYQLWFVTKDNKPVSLGVFTVGDVATTTASYIATVPAVPGDVNVAAISIEPEGGSPESGPTGPIIMTGPPKSE